MGDFVKIVTPEEHKCGPFPGWFSRWVNGHEPGSIIMCTTTGCGRHWKLVSHGKKLVWEEAYRHVWMSK